MRRKNQQTLIEKQHEKLLKKRGISVSEWEEQHFKQMVTDVATKNEVLYEDILDIYRAKDLNAEFEAFLDVKSDDKKGKSTLQGSTIQKSNVVKDTKL
ncbi:MAG TPA: hypothetical protein H9829_03725 [Candidatus Tetragenococcus pullicola]|nr:hypothetical protein [Candidatus Tetragenococcus pullicola]